MHGVALFTGAIRISIKIHAVDGLVPACNKGENNADTP